MTATGATFFRSAVFLVGTLLLTNCTSSQMVSPITEDAGTAKSVPIGDGPEKEVYAYTAADRECLKRVMYFESKRSSKNGFMAVGTVVMNRLTSEAYPNTICDVVTQENQFAPGLMTKAMDEETAPEIEEAINAILRGERHPQVNSAMFFHQKGMKFPYRNMHYVTVAGGNAFYEKRGRDGELQTPEPKSTGEYVLSFVQDNHDPLNMRQANEQEMKAVPDTNGDLMLSMVIPTPLPRPDQKSKTSTETASMSPEDWQFRTASR